MRDSALEFHEKGLLKLSLPEIVLLKEVSCVFDKGQVKEVQKFNKFIDNLQLRFALFLRAFGIDGGLDTGDHRWYSFKRALSFRDSITHPKGSDTYTPDAETMQHLKGAIAWFTGQITSLLDKCLDVVGEPVGK